MCHLALTIVKNSIWTGRTISANRMSKENLLSMRPVCVGRKTTGQQIMKAFLISVVVIAKTVYPETGEGRGVNLV